MSITRQLLDKLSFHGITAPDGCFKAGSYDLGYPNLYGGQVLAQALGAVIAKAEQDQEQSNATPATPVTPRKQAHSLHGYFLKSGNWENELVYQASPQSLGASYDRYSISASQNQAVIFSGAVSLKQTEASAYEHADTMEQVPSWEGLDNDEQIRARYQAATHPRPIEVRPIDPIDWVAPVAKPARRCFWFCFKEADTAGPITLAEKQQLIAYASDYGIVSVALMPHGVTWYQGNIYVASLDHAIWFYNDIDLNRWFLCDCACPVAQDGRALIHGKIYDQERSLVASFSQEALLRTRRPKKGS